MLKIPVKVIFELKNIDQLEAILDIFEKIRDTHSNTVINAEIRVRVKD